MPSPKGVKKKQKTNTVTPIPGFWNAVIQNNSKIIFFPFSRWIKKVYVKCYRDENMEHGFNQE